MKLMNYNWNTLVSDVKIDSQKCLVGEILWVVEYAFINRSQPSNKPHFHNHKIYVYNHQSVESKNNNNKGS